jgi:hypothetical protein
MARVKTEDETRLQQETKKIQERVNNLEGKRIPANWMIRSLRAD